MSSFELLSSCRPHKRNNPPCLSFFLLPLLDCLVRYLEVVGFPLVACCTESWYLRCIISFLVAAGEISCASSRPYLNSAFSIAPTVCTLTAISQLLYTRRDVVLHNRYCACRQPYKVGPKMAFKNTAVCKDAADITKIQQNP